MKVDAADQLVQTLLHSPVLEQARLAISAGEVNVKVAQNQTLPQLDIQATVTPEGQAGPAGNFGRSSYQMFNCARELHQL